MPFVWPKKAPSLQLRVLFCFLLLGAGRVANVYVPVLYKMLGNKIITSAPTHLDDSHYFDCSWQYDPSRGKCHLPLGSRFDLRCRQVPPGRRHGWCWISQQPKKLPLDSRPAVHNSRNRGQTEWGSKFSTMSPNPFYIYCRSNFSITCIVLVSAGISVAKREKCYASSIVEQTRSTVYWAIFYSTYSPPSPTFSSLLFISPRLSTRGSV